MGIEPAQRRRTLDAIYDVIMCILIDVCQRYEQEPTERWRKEQKHSTSAVGGGRRPSQGRQKRECKRRRRNSNRTNSHVPVERDRVQSETAKTQVKADGQECSPSVKVTICINAARRFLWFAQVPFHHLRSFDANFTGCVEGCDLFAGVGVDDLA